AAASCHQEWWGHYVREALGRWRLGRRCIGASLATVLIPAGLQAAEAADHARLSSGVALRGDRVPARQLPALEPEWAAPAMKRLALALLLLAGCDNDGSLQSAAAV